MRYEPAGPITKDHLTDTFECGSESQTTWLRKYAFQADRSDTTRVRVVSRAGDRRVVGYYALSAGSVEPGDVPERIRKGLPRYAIPVVILTRLGVDTEEQGQGLGRALVKDALLRVAEASETIGARSLLIHCESDQAKGFYQSHFPNFAESPTDPLHLYMLMSDLRKTLESISRVG